MLRPGSAASLLPSSVPATTSSLSSSARWRPARSWLPRWATLRARLLGKPKVEERPRLRRTGSQDDLSHRDLLEGWLVMIVPLAFLGVAMVVVWLTMLATQGAHQRASIATPQIRATSARDAQEVSLDHTANTGASRRSRSDRKASKPKMLPGGVGMALPSATAALQRLEHTKPTTFLPPTTASPDPDAGVSLTDSDVLFMAGIPRFKAQVFARDSLLSALVMRKPQLLMSVVKLCLRKQGTKTDPRTGEEPGKIFHEFPGVDLKGRNTAYAAIDTTPLFLLAANVLLKGMSEPAPENEVLSFLERLEEGVQRALAFVLAHISDEGLYFDAPATTTSSKDRSRGGHERFALPHTYWKDSPNLANSGAGKYPSYPVSYSVAHAYALLALDASLETLALFRTLSEAWEPTRGSLSSSGTVAGNARARTLVGDVQEAKARLIEGLPLLVAPSGLFVDFKDATGQSKGVSSDTLHVLAFLKPEYLQEAGIDVSGYEGLTSDLHTEVGIATTETFKDPSTARNAGVGDMYHQGTVWAIEQVLIFSGALRHRLFWIARVALRHVAALKRSAQDDEFWEFMRMSDDGKVWVGAGNHLQLWTVAAAHYFEHYLQTGEVSFLDGSLSTRAGAVAACTFHGVRPGVEERYCCLVEERARNQSCDDTFKCLDEMTVITFDQLNDDVCDCPDGSDEKGSSACGFADGCMFACEDGSGLAILPSVHRSSRRGDVAKGSRVDDHGKTRMKEGIWSTMVQDGICDCNDCSDEYRW